MARYAGVLVALAVITSWFISLGFLLNYEPSWKDPVMYLMIFIQMHLYTGLFITAHDAMHGTVSSNTRVNNLIGWVCTILYALFPFNKLREKHHRHHRFVNTVDDPDHSGNGFLRWYIKFIREYISWWQILMLAIIFNILKLAFEELNLVIFWVLPSLLSTVQLFYFGTWLPHHGEHDNRHRSRTMKRNHIAAFLSCYFFGYHYEHHDDPSVPWWKLWKVKDAVYLPPDEQKRSSFS